MRTPWLQAGALVALVRDLRLEVYSLKKAETGLEALLKQVADLLARHTGEPLLRECVRTLLHCMQGPAAARVRTQWAPALAGSPT